MRGRRQEHSLLSVYFLQPKISSQQVPVRDLPLLHQFLNGLPHLGFVRRSLRRSRLGVWDQPITLRPQTNPRAMNVRREINRHIEFLFAGFQLLENFLAIRAQYVSEQVQIRLGVQAFGVQMFLRVEICEENLAGAVRNDQRAFKSIQKAGDKLQHLLVAGLLLGCGAFRQIALPALLRNECKYTTFAYESALPGDEVVDANARKAPK